MRLDYADPVDVQRGLTYHTKLLESKAKVELRKITTPKSINQNGYLHVVITLWAIHFGYTLLEAKVYLKRQYDAAHPGSFLYEKNGDRFLRSTASLDTAHTAHFITWIRTQSSMQGHYIHTAEEYLIHKFKVDNHIKSHQEYL